MYVRGAKNREEVWLLDRLEEIELTDPAFRSRDYVVALDEETGEKVGFGRFRVHAGDPEVCEIAAVGVLEGYRGRGVGAHVVERLVERSRDEGFEAVYAFTEIGAYFAQFGFDSVPESGLPETAAARLAEVRESTPDAAPVVLDVEDFEMPPRLRRRFKRINREPEEDDPEESPEDFGIDPDEATYKYDTG